MLIENVRSLRNEEYAEYRKGKMGQRCGNVKEKIRTFDWRKEGVSLGHGN